MSAENAEAALTKARALTQERRVTRSLCGLLARPHPPPSLPECSVRSVPGDLILEGYRPEQIAYRAGRACTIGLYRGFAAQGLYREGSDRRIIVDGRIEFVP